MTRYRSRQAETEDVNERRLRRGVVTRQHIQRWAVGATELAPGVVGETHLTPRIINETHLHPETVSDLRGSGQLLVLTASGASVASGGGYVAFDAIAAQHQFVDVTTVGESWVHPEDAIYVLTYEHSWESYGGGGTIDLELDGDTTIARRIGTGTGTRGRGSISYRARQGQVGKVKVTQTSGSAQTCDGTMWLAISDPNASEAALVGVPGSASVVLYIDGVAVAWASGDVGASFSTATILMGELQGVGSVSASTFFYDQVKIVRSGVNLASNSGFESALLAGTDSVAVAEGNWRHYEQNAANTVDRIATPVFIGSWSGGVDIVSGSGHAGYYIQDVDVEPGNTFDLEMRVYPTAGTQKAGLSFDWDRISAAPFEALIEMSATATSFSAFGLTGSGPALAYDQWSHVRLRIGVVS